MKYKQLYDTDLEFKEHVDKFVRYERNKGNYISPDQALEYAIIGEYALCLMEKRNESKKHC